MPFLSSGDLPGIGRFNPGIEPGSPALQADSSPSEPPGKPNLYMEIKLIDITSYYFMRILLFRFSWKMQLLSTLVWLLGLQMNQLIFPPSFFQQTFIMWLFWLKHCVHCWIHSKKGNRKKEITRSSFYAHCLARKSPLQGVLVQCSLVTEKLSPSYVIKLL